MGSEGGQEKGRRKGGRGRGGSWTEVVQLSQQFQQASSYCASISFGARIFKPTLEYFFLEEENKTILNTLAILEIFIEEKEDNVEFSSQP